MYRVLVYEMDGSLAGEYAKESLDRAIDQAAWSMKVENWPRRLHLDVLDDQGGLVFRVTPANAGLMQATPATPEIQKSSELAYEIARYDIDRVGVHQVSMPAGAELLGVQAGDRSRGETWTILHALVPFGAAAASTRIVEVVTERNGLRAPFSVTKWEGNGAQRWIGSFWNGDQWCFVYDRGYFVHHPELS